MSRALSLTLAGAVLAVLMAGGVYYASRPVPAGEEPAASRPFSAAPRTSASPSTPAPDAARPAVRPRAGRVFPLDAALKELDLIRPPRAKAADDFTVPLVRGGHFRLAEHRGRPVFINFWATWCAPCREEMPAMERLWRQQKDNGLVMVAVSLDADPAAVPPFVAEHHLTFPVALDPRLEAANRYGVRALPMTLVVDRQGMLAAMALGPRAWDTDAAHSLVEALAR